MGALWSRQEDWPDEIFVVDCPRAKFYEALFSPDAVLDWESDCTDIVTVRDGDVAPGLLFKTGYAKATVYVQFLAKEPNARVQYMLYWLANGPPIRQALTTDAEAKPPHEVVKQAPDFSYNVEFLLSDVSGREGARLERTFSPSSLSVHARTRRFTPSSLG
jgi:hypothetical protein